MPGLPVAGGDRLLPVAALLSEKFTLGGKYDGRSDPRTDKQRSRKH